MKEKLEEMLSYSLYGGITFAISFIEEFNFASALCFAELIPCVFYGWEKARGLDYRHLKNEIKFRLARKDVLYQEVNADLLEEIINDDFFRLRIEKSLDIKNKETSFKVWKDQQSYFYDVMFIGDEFRTASSKDVLIKMIDDLTKIANGSNDNNSNEVNKSESVESFYKNFSYIGTLEMTRKQIFLIGDYEREKSKYYPFIAVHYHPGDLLESKLLSFSDLNNSLTVSLSERSLFNDRNVGFKDLGIMFTKLDQEDLQFVIYQPCEELINEGEMRINEPEYINQILDLGKIVDEKFYEDLGFNVLITGYPVKKKDLERFTYKSKLLVKK